MQPLVTGQVVPGMQMALDIVTASHYKLMRDVPIVGWDVTFTPHGIYLLEVPSSHPPEPSLSLFVPLCPSLL